ncbi:MAG: HAMP domain-containing histidine kinase [Bacteroidales bacterium]|nr:HAMP domain-containing histidine kinase [Bacteroidales bacterium]
MNISSRIRIRINTILLVVSISFMIVAVWAIFSMVQQIRDDERHKVITWVSSVQQKADLIEYSRNFFEQVERMERDKLQFWAESVLGMNRTISGAEFEFHRRVVEENTTIPVIVTDRHLRVMYCANVEFDCEQVEVLEGCLFEEFSQHPPLVIPFMGDRWYFFYKHPQAFRDLQEILDDVIHSFIDEIATSSIFAAVLVVSEDEQTVIKSGNMPADRYSNQEVLRRTLNYMRAQNVPVEFYVGADERYLIFYESSMIARWLAHLPIAAFIIFGIFVVTIIWGIKMSKQSENNKLWVGMSRETAHQLGTPLSSLMGWMEILKNQNVDEQYLTELGKDVDRLTTISERFSKIGSRPKMDTENIVQIVHKSIAYLRPRVSQKTKIQTGVSPNAVMLAGVNAQLLEWVLENLIVNAVDAIGVDDGLVDIEISEQPKTITIDVTDNGKGIPKKEWKTIFEAGYTTKSRGWGLGLPLCYRIIHNYHNGEIFVKQSVVGEGTTIRIILKK